MEEERGLYGDEDVCLDDINNNSNSKHMRGFLHLHLTNGHGGYSEGTGWQKETHANATLITNIFLIEPKTTTTTKGGMWIFSLSFSGKCRILWIMKL